MHTHNIIIHNNAPNKNNISSTTTKTNNKNTTQACAACKYRRRKCTSDCILAPYFPYDRQPHFLNAHRLFGVSNIVKIVSHLSPTERDLAMHTIIFESNVRAADPIGGCYRIIRDLEQQISLAKAELEIVLHHLAICRAITTDQKKYDEQYVVVEDEVVNVDDEDLHACAESTSSSFHDHHHYHGRRLSTECTNDMITPILEHLACGDDFRDEEIKYETYENITPSSFTERDTYKEDDECLLYIQEQQDLKAAATFIGLTR